MEHREYTGMMVMMVRARSDRQILSLTGISELNRLLLWSLDSGMTFCSVWSGTEKAHRCAVFFAVCSTFTRKKCGLTITRGNVVWACSLSTTQFQNHILIFCESLCPELVRARKDLVCRLLRWQDILWRISLAVSNTHPWCQVSCRLSRSEGGDLLSVCISGLFLSLFSFCWAAWFYVTVLFSPNFSLRTKDTAITSWQRCSRGVFHSARTQTSNWEKQKDSITRLRSWSKGVRERRSLGGLT